SRDPASGRDALPVPPAGSIVHEYRKGKARRTTMCTPVGAPGRQGLASIPAVRHGLCRRPCRTAWVHASIDQPGRGARESDAPACHRPASQAPCAPAKACFPRNEMIDTLQKTWALLAPAERRRAFPMLALIVLMAAAETLGVVSVMPFLSVIARPSVIHEHAWLSKAYALSGLEGTRAFTIGLG